MSHFRKTIAFFSIFVIIFVGGQTSTVHAALNYSLTLSTGRVQEMNSPGVAMTLNISNTTPGQILGFSWNVTDPSGSTSSFFSAAAANGPFLILTAVYPRDFTGAAVRYNGTYRINIFQTYPSPTILVATGKFYAGLTDSLVYQRTAQVSILAQGYASSENITIRIWHAGMSIPGFPRFQLANGNGVFSYNWAIPVSVPLGNCNVTLSGQTTLKRPSDSQILSVIPTSVSISQLAANMTLHQGSQIAVLSFAAYYPDRTQAMTGGTMIRVVEPDGATVHQVSMSYNATSNLFQGTYRIATSSPAGGWVAIIDSGAFDDGYGNVGPSNSVVRGFVVAPVTSQMPQASTDTYVLLVMVILLAGALALLVSWVWVFGGKKVQRNVLKVDFQSIEREAARVENRDFFEKVRDQLKNRQETRPEEESKNG